MMAPTSLESEVCFRAATEADAPLLLDSWMRSFRKSQGHVPGPIYAVFQREKVLRLLGRSAVSVLVACNPEDASQVFAYAASERRGGILVLHYLYTKHAFRRMGIGTLLLRRLEALGCHYTHRTPAGERLARRFSAHFNPYFAGDVS